MEYWFSEMHTDNVKESLFNILQFEVQGAVFADLFAGSGAIGIEALSRGADRALFSMAHCRVLL